MKKNQKTIIEYEKVLTEATSGHLLSDCHFFLAVSGGVDSMVMSNLFLHWSKTQGVQSDHITILHYNHKQRENAESDVQFVRSVYEDYSVVVSHRSGGIANETELRDARFLFFKDNCKRIASGKKQFLLLGHHLNDRIETTIMNMKRGCDLPGILNMRTIQDAWFDKDITLLRPLLSLPKDLLIDYAEVRHIHYLTDSTNELVDYTWRNKVRAQMSLSKSDYVSLGILYQELEEVFTSGLSQVTLQRINPAYSCGHLGYGIDISTDVDSRYILRKLGFYSFSTGFLQEFTDFISLDSGIIIINNSLFMRSLKKTYRFNTDQLFRTVNKTEDDSGYGFIQDGDQRKGKSAKRYCMEQGIPLFARNSISVERTEGVITGINIPSFDEFFVD